MESATVVVVGAGVAGLACARDLRAAGTDVVVLEARDRTGGRVMTLRHDGGPPVELGAQVVHHSSDDALDDLLDELGLPTTPLATKTAIVVVEDGQRRNAIELMRAHPSTPWLAEHLLADEPGTVAEAFGDLPTEVRQRALAWLNQSVGGDVGALPAAAVTRRRDARRHGGERVLPGGFDEVVAALADGTDVRLASPVEVVRWSTTEVQLVGSTAVRARAVVLTVPPPVVGAGTIRVEPALPADKVAGLSGSILTPGVAVHVALEDPALLSSWVLLRDRPGGLWRISEGSDSVVGHAKGPAAAVARDWPWSAGGAADVIGRLDPRLTGVRDVHVVDWGADCWSLGAFTLPSSTDDAAQAWAAPLPPLFFAGEATAGQGGRALVQGALSSGARAAREVLDHLASTSA